MNQLVFGYSFDVLFLVLFVYITILLLLVKVCNLHGVFILQYFLHGYTVQYTCTVKNNYDCKHKEYEVKCVGNYLETHICYLESNFINSSGPGSEWSLNLHSSGYWATLPPHESVLVQVRLHCSVIYKNWLETPDTETTKPEYWCVKETYLTCALEVGYSQQQLSELGRYLGIVS